MWPAGDGRALWMPRGDQAPLAALVCGLRTSASCQSSRWVNRADRLLALGIASNSTISQSWGGLVGPKSAWMLIASSGLCRRKGRSGLAPVLTRLVGKGTA